VGEAPRPASPSALAALAAVSPRNISSLNHSSHITDYVCYFTWQIFELDFVTVACSILDLLVLETANIISLFWQ
jgi:hypothetical protein